MTPKDVEDRREKVNAVIDAVQGVFPEGADAAEVALIVRIIMSAYGLDGEEAVVFLGWMKQQARAMEADAIAQTAIYEAKYGEKP